MEQTHARAAAGKIASVHAYDRHVVLGEDFPEVKSREEFANLIFEVLTQPQSVSRLIRQGREALWNESLRTIVILDRQSEDGGTTFRPTSGRAYFRFLR